MLLITNSGVNKYKGLIFDMDNTLLSSNINFDKMKRGIYDYLLKHDLLLKHVDLTKHTVSTLIKVAKKNKNYNELTNKKIWHIIGESEAEGMQNACLEPGVREVLDVLYNNYIMVILTNNSYEAALEALQNNLIEEYFSLIVTRDDIEELKPSSAGVKYILNFYKRIPEERWLMIGDSWIDGKAAIKAGINFLAYRADDSELQKNGIKHLANLNNLIEIYQYI